MYGVLIAMLFFEEGNIQYGYFFLNVKAFETKSFSSSKRNVKGNIEDNIKFMGKYLRQM